MPRLSVIIPAFNGASRYLDEAIGSVLTQSYGDRELIVVDDGSTDETGRLVLRFPQARYFRRGENGGQAAARNDGARLATGEFLAFLDQDDLWEPTFLAEAVAAIEKAPDAAALHTDGYQVSERNEVLEYDAAMKHTPTITQMLRGGHDVATSGALFRKRCFDSVGGYDAELRVWEDIDLAIRLYQRYPLRHLPKPLYRHRLYGHNVSRDIPSERALEGRRRFLEKHAAACPPDSAFARPLARDWGQYYSDLGKFRLRHGSVRGAREAFWLAMRYNPFDRKTFLRVIRSYLTPGGPQPMGS
jgi:glycosyltransferase involved in cell wall biosynthesis